jgi:hypothetical protein
MKNNQPKYFSDQFNIDKAKLKELGVFDPILNFDTKIFVEPLLLKNSSNEIIRNSIKTFDQFFIDLLTLLKISTQEDDKPWRQAQRVVKFPEYKYTCIGYGGDSINGSGSGAWLNDKILQSAKDIVNLAKDDPKIFLILPLLEEGVGADIISDMTQNIIDKNICEFTIDIMQKLDLKANCLHKARDRSLYDLIKNPFNNCPIKLLPNDILSDLPLADSLDDWLAKMTDINSDLRDSVNKHIGASWIDETKTKKKETLLDLLKNDKSFFIQVLEALKTQDFSHYDIEEDWQGLHRWLKDSEQFIKFKPANKVGFLNDDLEEICLAVAEIVDHFKYLIEKEELWRIFWTKQYSKLAHVKEFYSQMLFYMVASSWVDSKDNNLSCVRSFNSETKMIDFKFSVSGKYSVDVQVKHSDNYNGLKKGYDKKIKQKVSRLKARDFYVVMNFNEEKSKQLKEIQQSPEEGFKIVEIDVVDQDNKQGDIFDFNSMEMDMETDFEFDNMLTEYDVPKLEDKYLAEKSKGGLASYQKYKPLRDKVFELCESELKKKKYSSAEQLCKKVAKTIEDQHLSLLDNFEPYQLVLEDGGDWLKPTFYGWCNKVYKRTY